MKNSIFLFTLFFGLLTTSLWTQTTNVDPSAALEVDSSIRGFLPPRMTVAQRDAIPNPAQGLLIFNIDTQNLNFFNGIEWGNFYPHYEGPESPEALDVVTTIITSTGKTWMEYNLGAIQVATAFDDQLSQGYLYQWGRNADGHQLRNSPTAVGPVDNGNEGNNFITGDSNWLSGTLDNTRWNGASKGAHDPCPDGFRVPTVTELDNERAAFTSNDIGGAFQALKLSTTGRRNYSNEAEILGIGNTGYYWSSTTSGNYIRFMSVSNSWAGILSAQPAYGSAVRCIEE